MARNERNWHPKFVEYMKMIVSSKNFAGYPFPRKSDGSIAWVTTKNSLVGKARLEWADGVAKTIGLKSVYSAGASAELMREIHPTKIHICQICGSEMSIYYHYPNVSFVKALQQEFGFNGFGECDHISDIWDTVIELGTKEVELVEFFIKKFSLPNSVAKTKDAIIKAAELVCRKGECKHLGPGAMSDFPDRFDGFHTYNRCCRATQDTGRSKENLKSYTKDRRAFEYWSDGNIHAANMFMGSQFFNGLSADHIGPISLGFVHDSLYLRPLTGGENSTKRDRLQLADIEECIIVENKTGVCPMSWYSQDIWKYICDNYKNEQNKIGTMYRDILKQNLSNFMFVLQSILNNCNNNGYEFLFDNFIKVKEEYFQHSYEFNEFGEIIKQTPRHKTERSANEFERFKRIAFQSVFDYNDKENRHSSPDLTANELQQLSALYNFIKAGDYKAAMTDLIQLNITIQRRLIDKI
jgi:Alw26I/Eco31I/Esp3I family type II restriction endonuclease